MENGNRKEQTQEKNKTKSKNIPYLYNLTILYCVGETNLYRLSFLSRYYNSCYNCCYLKISIA